eukprot:g4825.t1
MRYTAGLALIAAAALGQMDQPGTPPGVPSEYDCAFRKAAYEYGQKLLPKRGSFRTLFEALQLQWCGMDTPAEYDEYAPPTYDTPTSGTIVFVAPDGKDTNPGTKDAPFLTIAHAVKATADKADASVLLRAGSYFVPETVEIGMQNNGLTIQNYNGEAAVVTGARDLSVPKASWKPYKQQMGWETHAGSNNVYGAAQSRADKGTIKYLGTFDTDEACLAAVKADADKKGPFKSFTHHGKDFGGDFAGQCFGRTDDSWAPHAEDDVTSGLFVNQNTWVADVSAAGFKEMPGLRVNGQRAIRAKYPNGDPEQSGHFLQGAGASMGGGDYVKGWVPLSANTQWVPPFRKPDSEEIVITAADWPGVEWPMTEDGGSSWTGEGDWGEYHLGLGGYCDDLEPAYGYWCAMNPPRGQCWDKKTNKGSGCVQTHMSPEGMVLERAHNYSDPTTAVVQSWRGGGRWFTQQWSVENFVAENSTLMFDRTTGMQGGEGGTTSGQWWIENVKEECDDANEWFFDEKEQKLYFNPNTTDASGPTGEERWAVPLTRTLFSIAGTQQAPVENVTIRGVTLRDARYTYLDAHGMPSGGDWALQRSAAVVLEGTRGVTLADSLVTRVDGNGIGINGYNRDATIARNEFTWIGDSAMFAWGHTGNCLNENCTRKLPDNVKGGPDGRGGEQPRGINVINNLVRELGIWQKQSSMWFQAVSAQNNIVDNVHFNGPRAGVNFNDGFGGGDVMKGNLIANCVRESGDHGPFNSWDRVPYITNIRTGKPSIIPEFREVTQNFIVSTYSSQEAIDTDDGSAYYNTHDNFFVYAANGLKSDFGGHHNYHNDNLYGFVNNCWGGGNSNEFINNTCVANSASGGFGSDCKKAPLMTVSGNKVSNSDGKWTIKVCDKSNTVAKWPSPDAVIAQAKGMLNF